MLGFRKLSGVASGGHEVPPALVKPGVWESFGTTVGVKQALESRKLRTALPWSRFLRLWEDPAKPPARHQRTKNFKEMSGSRC